MAHFGHGAMSDLSLLCGLKADIGQAFTLDLNSVLARTLTECPIDGRTPNSERLGNGRRADALLLERPPAELRPKTYTPATKWTSPQPRLAAS